MSEYKHMSTKPHSKGEYREVPPRELVSFDKHPRLGPGCMTRDSGVGYSPTSFLMYFVGERPDEPVRRKTKICSIPFVFDRLEI